MSSQSPERRQSEPVPSIGTLFHGFAYIAIRQGRYHDPASSSDAPGYSPVIPEEARKAGLLSVIFTTQFRDINGDRLDPSLRLVWNEGSVDKNVTFVRSDDDTIFGASLSQLASERTGTMPELTDLDPVEAAQELIYLLEEIDNVAVTDDELRSIGKFLKMMQEDNG